MRKQYHTRSINGDQHTWDVHRLVRLAKTYSPEDVPLAEIIELDELWWFQSEGDVPTPRAVAAHMDLVKKTDLSFPIVLCSEGRLMDGMHRVLKALLNGQKTISAVRLVPTPDPDFINPNVDELPYPDEEI